MVCGAFIFPANETLHRGRTPFQNISAALAHQHMDGAVLFVPGLYADSQKMDGIGATVRPGGTPALRALGGDTGIALVGCAPVPGLADCEPGTVAGGDRSFGAPFLGGLSRGAVDFADRDRSRLEI